MDRRVGGVFGAQGLSEPLVGVIDRGGKAVNFNSGREELGQFGKVKRTNLLWCWIFGEQILRFSRDF